MTTQELRLCVSLARDERYDTRGADSGALFGFGCADFEPKSVPLAVVVACLRWQCLRFNGTWDCEQFNEDRRFYLRNVGVDEMTGPGAYAFLIELTGRFWESVHREA